VENLGPPVVSDLVGDVCREIEMQFVPAFVPLADRRTDALMTRLETILRCYRNRPDDTLPELMKVAEFFEVKCPVLVQDVWRPGGSKAEKKERAEQLQEWWERQVDRFQEPLRLWRAYRYRRAVPLLRAATEAYAELRLDLGKLSFHDLLTHAARLLRTSPEARGAAAARYPFLLVDEFQDTDPLQAEVMLLLTSTDPNETDWRRCLPRPGSLFVVGDPKQSIYRFRRADITTFEFVKQRIRESGGEWLSLITNFRTNRGLVEWVNQSYAGEFARHHQDREDPAGPAFSASFVGRREQEPGELSGIRRLRVTKGGTLAEAQAVARFIRRAIEQKIRIPRTESETRRGVLPACRPEDFLIVTYNTSELSTFANALHAEGVPVDVTGRKGADHVEILLTLRMCLQVTTDPDDAISALAVLRGPVFGFSDADLYRFHQAGGQIDGWFRVPQALNAKDGSTDESRFRDASEAFARWRRFSRTLPVVAAVERICDDAGLLLVAAAAGGDGGPLGRGAAGAIACFFERVRAERSLMTSLHEVVDRLDQLLEPSLHQDFDTLSLDAGAGGAVRVMNLHKVKGLEAPVVFLSDEAGPHEIQPSWHIARNQETTQGFLRITKPRFPYGSVLLAEPLEWQERAAVETRFLEAELLRLQYVAATRPGACLVVSVYENAKREPVGGWTELAGFLEGVPDLPLLTDGPAAGAGSVGGAMVHPQPAHTPLEPGLDQMEARLAEMRAATYATVRPHAFLTEPTSTLRFHASGLGQEWGTVIHRLLELTAENSDANGRLNDAFDLAGAARSAIEASEMEADHSDLATRAESLIREIMASPLWQRARESPRSYVEVPLTIQVASRDLPDRVRIDAGPEARLTQSVSRDNASRSEPEPVLPTVIHAQLDLVFRESPGAPSGERPRWTIVDWKTTSVNTKSRAELEAYYAPQLDLYRLCWSAVLQGVQGSKRDSRAT
jgi:ATP-dependent helicase/nuclease subunit A